MNIFDKNAYERTPIQSNYLGNAIVHAARNDNQEVLSELAKMAVLDNIDVGVESYLKNRVSQDVSKNPYEQFLPFVTKARVEKYLADIINNTLSKDKSILALKKILRISSKDKDLVVKALSLIQASL